MVPFSETHPDFICEFVEPHLTGSVAVGLLYKLRWRREHGYEWDTAVGAADETASAAPTVELSTDRREYIQQMQDCVSDLSLLVVVLVAAVCFLQLGVYLKRWMFERWM